MVFDQQGFQTTSELWTGSLFRERGVEAILGAHVSKVEDGLIHYERPWTAPPTPSASTSPC